MVRTDSHRCLFQPGESGEARSAGGHGRGVADFDPRPPKAPALPHDAAARLTQTLFTLAIVMLVSLTVSALAARFILAELHNVVSQFPGASVPG